MSLVNSMFGFGGVKFILYYGSSNQYTLIQLFDGGFSDIVYKPVFLERENILHEDVSKLLGFKAELEVELINVKDDDYLKFANLMGMLNYMRMYPNSILHIYPQYDENISQPDDYNLKIENMRLDSNFNPKQLANIEVGQSLTLSFYGKGLLNEIPVVFSQPEVDHWVDENGNNFVDESGNTFII